MGEDAGAMLSGAFEIVAERIGADLTFNYLLDEEAGELALKASAGLDDAQRLACARIPIGVAPCGTVAARRAPVIREWIQQSTEEMTAVARGLGIRTYAGFPLLAGERLLGTIGFASRSRDAFTAEELALIQTVAAQAAATLERGRLEQEARASAAQLRLALEGAGAGAWSWEPRKGRAFLDAQLLRLHGFDRPAGHHRTPTILRERVHPCDRTTMQDALCACTEGGGGEFRIEYRVRLPGGEVRWLAAAGQSFADEAGRVVSVVGLVHDVTAAVAARERLAREAAQLDRLAEQRATRLAEAEERLAHASRMRRAWRRSAASRAAWRTISTTSCRRWTAASRSRSTRWTATRRRRDGSSGSARRPACGAPR